MKEVYLYKKLPEKKVQCQNCAHYCTLAPGQRGKCGVRENIDGIVSIILTKSLLKNLYINKKFSMEKVSKTLHLGISTVWKFIHKYNIPVRRFKYKKYDFSKDPAEKAYLLGLVAGDFCAYKHSRQIAVEITTTHPAMMELFHSVFKKYGTPTERIKYNKITGRYERVGHVFLNDSFKFLLSKNFDINNKYFYHFLAGFFDSEGCVHVYNNHGYIGLSILIYNSNRKLLEIIKNQLEKKGFTPKFYKSYEKGRRNPENYIAKKDLWAIGMHTIEEILTLMKKMPIKHREKIEKLKIVASSNSNKWTAIADRVSDLKAKINSEVKEFTKP